jgi:hypothetical protein
VLQITVANIVTLRRRMVIDRFGYFIFLRTERYHLGGILAGKGSRKFAARDTALRFAT